MSLLFRQISRRCAVVVVGLAACSPAALVEVPPPNIVVDPSLVTTPSGALQMYNMAVGQFAVAYGGSSNSSGGNDLGFNVNYLVVSAQLTDELMSAGSNVQGTYHVDRRDEGAGVTASNTYRILHEARTEQQQARQALRLYAPAMPQALQGRLYAFEGYVVLWLSELFCSGIPLTSVPLVGSPQRTRGYTTQELSERALALFDSAMLVGADSTAVVALAKIGKGRALLNLGKFTEAAATVRDVPTDFVSQTTYSALLSTGSVFVAGNLLGTNPRFLQVIDAEGGNGLLWSADPRAAITTTPALSGGMKISAKYSRTASGTLDAAITAPATPIRLADGLEARLIEAEAALATGGTNWLALVNALRAACVGAAVCAPVPGVTAAVLPPLPDPGTANARLDLIMKERAMWLYLTGHRQGDLRRLARVYQRDPQTLYPTGTYVSPGFPPLVPPGPANGTLYGEEVVLLPPAAEQNGNPLYGGCYDAAP